MFKFNIINIKNRIKKIRIGIILKTVMWIIASAIALIGLILGIVTAIGLWSTGNYIIAFIAGIGFIVGAAIIAFTFISICVLIYNTLLYEIMARETAEKIKKDKFDVNDIDV